MYSNIINPITNTTYAIKSKKGKQLLYKYIQTGGILIGKGTYGCTYSPPLKCENRILRHNSNKYVSKIMNKHNANQELDIITNFKQDIPNSELFTLPLPTKCNIKDVDKRRDSLLKHCNIISGRTNLNTIFNKTLSNYKNDSYTIPKHIRNNLKLLIYEKGGIDLEQLKVTDIPDITQFYKNITNILYGIVSITEHKWCHKDIKLSNILYNPNSSKLITLNPTKYMVWYLKELNLRLKPIILQKQFNIIDFGLSLSWDKIFVYPYDLTGDNNRIFYEFWPTDFGLSHIMYTFIQQDNTEHFNINDIKTELLAYIRKDTSNVSRYTINPIIQRTIFNKNNLNRIQLSIENILLSTNKQKMFFLMKEYIYISKRKLDSYSIGILLLNILYKFKPKTTSMYNKIFNIVTQLVDLNPYTRKPVISAFIEYVNIVF